ELLAQQPTSLANSWEVTAVQDLIEQLAALNRPDDALPLTATALSYGAAPAAIFEKLYPRPTLAAEAWWALLRMAHPSESPRETVERLPALLDRRLASPEGRATLAAAIAAARQLPGDEGERWLQGLGEACQAAGLADDARTLTGDAAQKLDTIGGWLRLGDLLIEQRRFADAAAAYESAWRKDERQPLALWLMGFAKERAGDATGRRLRDRAHGVTLGDDDARAAFAEELAKRIAFGPELGDAARRER